MGPFHGQFFQTAYLTNNLGLARDQLGDGLGLTTFQRIDGPLPGGGKIAVELASAGGLMIELMQVTGCDNPLYARQPGEHEPFTLIHHHEDFEIIFSAERPVEYSGRCAKIDPQVRGMMVRYGMYHWVTEIDPVLSIACSPSTGLSAW